MADGTQVDTDISLDVFFSEKIFEMRWFEHRGGIIRFGQ